MRPGEVEVGDFRIEREDDGQRGVWHELDLLVFAAMVFHYRLTV